MSVTFVNVGFQGLNLLNLSDVGDRKQSNFRVRPLSANGSGNDKAIP
jgi:hypothetical protein